MDKCSVRKERGNVEQISTLRLTIKTRLNNKTPLVLSFIDYKHPANRTASVKVLSPYGIPDKYIRVINDTYKNITAFV